MKALFFVLLFACVSFGAFSQQATGIDTSLIFNQRYTQCERKWVLLPKLDNTQRYIYGLVYLDERAGFTLFVQGNLWIDKNGRYITDTAFLHNKAMRLKLSRNTANMALLPCARFAELHIQPQPDWLKSYYSYTDTVAYNFRRGFIFNDRGQPDSAMLYLNKVYDVQPHYKGVIFELIFAHNALGDYNGAIKIIQLALQTDQLNDLYYRELGFAYTKTNNYEKAITAYLTGINLCTTESQMDEKAEMAINLAGVYKSYGNDDQYRLWGAKAKAWAKPGTDIYNFIERERF